MILLAALAAGFGFRVGDWALSSCSSFFQGVLVAAMNRRAARLRAHQFHCEKCVTVCAYCPACFTRYDGDGKREEPSPP